jgi:alkyl hydroperoxide reductase subunit AhpC
VAQLRYHEEAIRRLGAQVLLLSFEGEARARAWLSDTDVPFPLLLDPGKDIYQAYGLERSLRRSWAPRTLWHYAQQVARGRRLYARGGDLHQLGGDFIVDDQGRVCFAHPSREPVDRPPAQRLLKEIEAISRDDPER